MQQYNMLKYNLPCNNRVWPRYIPIMNRSRGLSSKHQARMDNTLQLLHAIAQMWISTFVDGCWLQEIHGLCTGWGPEFGGTFRCLIEAPWAQKEEVYMSMRGTWCLSLWQVDWVSVAISFAPFHASTWRPALLEWYSIGEEPCVHLTPTN